MIMKANVEAAILGSNRPSSNPGLAADQLIDWGQASRITSVSSSIRWTCAITCLLQRDAVEDFLQLCLERAQFKD